MSKRKWLTDELDNTPYSYNKKELDELKNQADEILAKIKRYCEVHPKFDKQINSDISRENRFRKSAFSFLGLENDGMLDIVPTKDLTPEQKVIQDEQIKMLEAYHAACKLVHNYAVDENKYLDENMLIKVHNELCKGDPDKRLKTRYRLRNEDDNIIMVGQGYFAPIEGAKVAKRTSCLIYDAEFGWEKDNFFARLAKIVIEYIRIQPHLDGNKRMSFMLMNYYLEKNGYPVLYFTNNQKEELYSSIEEGMVSRDVTSFAKFILKTLNLCLENIKNEILLYRLQNFEKEDKENLNINGD